MPEFRSAEALQQLVWGGGDTPDPADLMMVIQAEGGLAGGAFLGERLVGYVFGFPTSDPAIQHSHRLAVAPDMRGLGIGSSLKWYQRDWCLSRGIRHVRWTFDPLKAINAKLNLNRLGACANTYLVDYYGDMGGINQGMASDRLLVDWFLDDKTVSLLSKGQGRDFSTEKLMRISLLQGVDPSSTEDVQDRVCNRNALRAELLRAFTDGHQICDFVDGSYVLRTMGSVPQ